MLSKFILCTPRFLLVFLPLYTALHDKALQQDLADAMATCEELDQTVTDLTDDLHAKVQ